MATAAAAIAARLRREVDQAFVDRDALSPERAIEFEPQAPIQQRYLDQLIAEGIVHEIEPGRYWFDMPAYREQRRQQFIWSMRILGLAAVVFAIVFVVQYFMKR